MVRLLLESLEKVKSDLGVEKRDFRQEGSVPLFLHGSAALGWLFRQSVSG
jgi:hypothetical protein